MNPLNLKRFSFLRRLAAPFSFQRSYRQGLKQARANADWLTFQEFLKENGEHPFGGIDFECAFAARHVLESQPTSILDIGSYRHFILGLLSHYLVTTVDVRHRQPMTPTETPLTCEGKTLPLPDDSFDLVLSLCTLEHFGLGRYGDEIDLDADTKTLAEMKRVLKPGGSLILSTQVTAYRPQIAFNAHRIYTLERIQTMFSNLILTDSAIYSYRQKAEINQSQITNHPRRYDLYCGAWRKR